MVEECSVHSQRPVPIRELPFSRSAGARKAFVRLLVNRPGPVLKLYCALAPLLQGGHYGDLSFCRGSSQITRLVRVTATLGPRSDSGGHVLIAGPTQPYTERISLYPAAFPEAELTRWPEVVSKLS